MKVLEPGILGNVRPDAKGLNILMLVPNVLTLRPPKQINEIRDPESLTSSVHGAQCLLRYHRAVECLNGRCAVVAVGAILDRLLTKIAKKKRPAAGAKVGELPHLAQLAEHYLRLFGIALDLGKALELCYIRPRKEQQRLAP